MATKVQPQDLKGGVVAPGNNKVYGTDGAGAVGFQNISTPASATETTEGIVERATDAEASSGTDTTRYITPKQLKDNILSSASEIYIAGTTNTAANMSTQVNNDLSGNGTQRSGITKNFIVNKSGTYRVTISYSEDNSGSSGEVLIKKGSSNYLNGTSLYSITTPGSAGTRTIMKDLVLSKGETVQTYIKYPVQSTNSEIVQYDISRNDCTALTS